MGQVASIPMTTLDVCIVIVFVLAFVRGSSRGFLVEVYGPLSVVAAIAVATQIAPPITTFLQERVFLDDARAVSVASGYVLAFAGLYGGLWLFGRLIARWALRGLIGTVNRASGGALAAAKWIFVLILVIVGSEIAGGANARAVRLADSTILVWVKDVAFLPLTLSQRAPARRPD